MMVSAVGMRLLRHHIKLSLKRLAETIEKGLFT